LAGTPGFDPLLQARSGLMHSVGAPGRPVSTGTPVHDVGSASLSALGALAALWALPNTGVGQRIDVALASSTLLLQSGEYTDFDGRPEAARGGVDFLGPTAARRYYRAGDDWIALAAQTTEQFRHALQVFGVDGEPALDSSGDGPLADAIAAAVAGRKVEELIAELQRHLVPAALVVPQQDALEADHLVLNDFSHVVLDRQFGRCRVVKRFAEWSRSAVFEAESMPALGEDGAAVLAEIGWDIDAVQRVLTNGTVMS
jgi:crotonobetainyl-CoA:carnitine CoA-transferase CaiB-like acyl-CoA transferase